MVPEPFLPIGNHMFEEKLGNEENKIRYRYWCSKNMIRQTKQLMDSYNTRRFKYTISSSTNNLRIITEFLSSHYRLRKYMYRIAISSDETYRFCELKPETTEHIHIFEMRSCSWN